MKNPLFRDLFFPFTRVLSPFSAVRFGKLCGEKFFAFSQTENDSLVIDLHICGFLCENRRNMRINMQKVFPTASGNHFFHSLFTKKG